MKQLFCILLLLSGLTSCSHDTPAPTPTLRGDKWTLQTETIVATSKDGAATTIPYPVDKQVIMTFTDDKDFSLDVTNANKSGYHFEGSYTYQGQVLTFPRLYIWNLPNNTVAPRTFRVVELSAHKLLMEYQWKNINIGDGYYEPTDYLTTQTYTR